MPDVIRFYSVTDDYGELSNFAPYSIQLDQHTWPTVEHDFQANKFLDKTYQQKIRKTSNPTQAAILGRDRKQKLRKDWESIKVQVMRRALEAKFQQHPELCDLLLGTGDAKLIEHTENDAYWGDGGNGKGKNMLGQLLMEVRQQLRNETR